MNYSKDNLLIYNLYICWNYKFIHMEKDSISFFLYEKGALYSGTVMKQQPKKQQKVVLKQEWSLVSI